MDNTKYMLIVIDKETGNITLTGKVSTRSHTTMWTQKCDANENLRKRFTFVACPVDSIEDDYMTLFDVLRTTIHR